MNYDDSHSEAGRRICQNNWFYDTEWTVLRRLLFEAQMDAKSRKAHEKLETHRKDVARLERASQKGLGRLYYKAN